MPFIITSKVTIYYSNYIAPHLRLTLAMVQYLFS